MKKGLSVLLIAAALFGFYGGAVNLNDVLACKDYWEVEGERSTADMNKLEDGLNQLKENEQAYLDGIDALAEGEEALAKGEADYAAGQATLAKGEADYAAAPGKLAAGEKKLAAGKAKLAAGYAARDKGRKDLKAAVAARAMLNTTKQKIEKVEPAYNPWLQKFDKLRKSIVDNPKNPSKGVLYDAGATAVGLSTINSGFATVKQKGEDGMAAIESAVRQKMIKKVMDDYMDAQTQGMTPEEAEAYRNDPDNQKTAKAYAESKVTDKAVKQVASTSTEPGDENGTPIKDLYAKAQGFAKLGTYLQSTYSSKLLGPAKQLNDAIGDVQGAEYQATELRKANIESAAKAGEDAIKELLADPQVSGAIAQFPDDTAELAQGVQTVLGLAQASQKSKSQYDKNYDELKPNAAMGKKIGSKVASATKAILSTPAIVAGLTGAQREALKKYTSASSITDLPNIELLYGTMTLGADKKDDGKNSLLDSLNAILSGAKGGLQQYDDGISEGKDALDEGDKKLAQGEKDLAAGKAELAKGYADYKAAPAKLAAGRAQLAEGLQKLMDGRKELADGKEKLAEYEDGEQQVRDGLATLMGTEPNGGLTSIFDRRSGDDDFDNGDNHLELDEGLEAVEVGRGYQADSGELITAEITKRAIGTALGLAAGALAVLAGILSLLKKNKGAGVCAILTAIAGGAGVAAGTSAGMEFSSIAGSAVGATPWIAFGVLAGVAVVHAIAHLSSKTAA